MLSSVRGRSCPIAQRPQLDKSIPPPQPQTPSKKNSPNHSPTILFAPKSPPTNYQRTIHKHPPQARYKPPWHSTLTPTSPPPQPSHRPKSPLPTQANSQHHPSPPPHASNSKASQAAHQKPAQSPKTPYPP